MTIYTRKGDKGKTDLYSGERISKNKERIEAYGTIDELNSIIGIVRSKSQDTEILKQMETIQNELHICQADLANKDRDIEEPRISQEHVTRLEDEIDKFDEELEDLEEFILPGGTESGSKLHHARTVCRRAERRIVELSQNEEISHHLLKYINRLADLLFTIARIENKRNEINELHPEY